MTKKIMCKDCIFMFEYTDEQQEFYKKKGWKAPVRCPACREVMRKRRADPYDGWESTMGPLLCAKKGHRRVTYPFHVVGGFR